MDKGFAQSDQAGYDHWINTRRRTVFVTLLRIYLKIRILVHIEERIILGNFFCRHISWTTLSSRFSQPWRHGLYNQDRAREGVVLT